MSRTITAKLRFSVFKRDSFTCQYCGVKAGDGAVLQLDHIVSIDAGGDDSEGNLITSCQTCNAGKRTKDVLCQTHDNQDDPHRRAVLKEIKQSLRGIDNAGLEYVRGYIIGHLFAVQDSSRQNPPMIYCSTDNFVAGMADACGVPPRQLLQCMQPNRWLGTGNLRGVAEEGPEVDGFELGEFWKRSKFGTKVGPYGIGWTN